ncbi:hypothetical protein pdam_00002299, partial [Pocillopora damicornis]
GVSMFSIYYQIQFVKWLKPLEEIYTRDFPFTRDSFEEYYKLSRAYIAFKAITLLVNLLLLVSIALLASVTFFSQKNQYLAITWLAWGIIDVLFMLALLFYCISEWKLQHRYLVGILAWCVIKVHLVIFFIFVMCAYIAFLRKELLAQDMEIRTVTCADIHGNQTQTVDMGHLFQYAAPCQASVTSKSDVGYPPLQAAPHNTVTSYDGLLLPETMQVDERNLSASAVPDKTTVTLL